MHATLLPPGAAGCRACELMQTKTKPVRPTREMLLARTDGVVLLRREVLAQRPEVDWPTAPSALDPIVRKLAFFRWLFRGAGRRVEARRWW